MHVPAATSETAAEARDSAVGGMRAAGGLARLVSASACKAAVPLLRVVEKSCRMGLLWAANLLQQGLKVESSLSGKQANVATHPQPHTHTSPTALPPHTHTVLAACRPGSGGHRPCRS
jgi:hypothetical protein